MPDPRVALVSRHLQTWEGLPPLPGDRFPIDAVQRLWSELAGTPDADTIAHAVAAEMGQTSATVDHQVVRFFENHPGAPGGECLFEALRMTPERFPVGGENLLPGATAPDARLTLMRASLMWGAIPDDLIATYRNEVLTPGRATALLDLLWRRDKAWVEANLNAILFASPEAGPIAFTEAMRSGMPAERAFEWVMARCERIAGRWDLSLRFDVSDPVVRARLSEAIKTR